MIALGLFLSVASVPGWTMVSIPAGWAAASLTLPWFQWRNFGHLHWLYVAFLAYAAVSLLWTPVPWEGGFRLWQVALWGLAFCLGASLESIRPLVKGLAIGCAISSAIAVMQWLGFQPVLFYSTSESSGLFYNSIWLGACLALMMIACWSFGLPWLALAQAPGIYLSGSRGAWAALALGALLILWRSNRVLLIACLAILVYVFHSTNPGDLERQAIYLGSAMNLSWLGNGSGSFSALYLILDGSLRHPDLVHNDALQLLFEFGLGAGPLLAIFAIGLANRLTDEWPILATFTFLSMFTFPLFYPVTAMVAMVCAGRLSRGWAFDGHRLSNLRRGWVLRHHPGRPNLSESRNATLPILNHT